MREEARTVGIRSAPESWELNKVICRNPLSSHVSLAEDETAHIQKEMA